jgi:hypothetical protein
MGSLTKTVGGVTQSIGDATTALTAQASSPSSSHVDSMRKAAWMVTLAAPRTYSRRPPVIEPSREVVAAFFVGSLHQLSAAHRIIVLLSLHVFGISISLGSQPGLAGLRVGLSAV